MNSPGHRRVRTAFALLVFVELLDDDLQRLTPQVLRDGQRRQEANDVVVQAAGQQQDALGLGTVSNLVHQLRVRLALSGHELECEHGTAATELGHTLIAQDGLQLLAGDLLQVLSTRTEVLLLKLLKGCQRSSARHRVTGV